MKQYIKISLFTCFAVFLLLFLIEFFLKDISLTLKKDDKLYLYQTNYYGKILEQDPYSEFTKKYLHPYYFFSLPWENNIINSINNSYVSLDLNGFRKSNLSNKKNAILLGGSVAFSHFASSNDKTISAYLSKFSNYNFININAPSWNSYQELIGLFNNNIDYSLSLSLSLANDVAVYCSNHLQNKELKIDAPELFFHLYQIVNKINSEETLDDRSFIKKLISLMYPKIYERLGYYKKKILKKKSEKIKSFECRYNTKEIAENFIKNQKKMRDLSISRNASHYTIIQPYHDLHLQKIKNLKGETLRATYEKVSKIVMSDEFCKKFCINLSLAFKNEDKKNLLYNFSKENNNHKEAIFVDNVHLTDLGNEKLAKTIIGLFKNN